MRPGQNKRMRGRNNNNNGGHRRGPNPLTRSYESNGPDVKIRGTAQHIGEKYLQLARDAQTSGDPVAAENYLQHAEHYFRIIAAAQQAQQQAQAGYQRQPGELEVDEGEGEDDLVMPDRFALPSERFAAQQAAGQQGGNGTGPQPYPERGGFNGERQGNGSERYDRAPGGDAGYRAERDQRPNGDQRQDREPRQEPRQDREFRSDREPRQDRDPRQDREPRQDRDQRPYGDRSGHDRNNGERGFRNDKASRGPRYPREGQDYREPRYAQPSDQPAAPATEAAAPEPAAELPAFITAPVRPVAPQPTPPVEAAPVPAAAPEPEMPAETASGQPAEGAEGEAFTVRPRRRRRTRAMIEADAAAAAAAAAGEAPASE